MAYVGMACIVIAHAVKAYIVLACTVMAHIAMAYMCHCHGSAIASSYDRAANLRRVGLMA